TPMPAAAVDLTSVPASMKPLLSTTGTLSGRPAKLGPRERYNHDEVSFYSTPHEGPAGLVIASLANTGGAAEQASHAVVKRSPAQASPDEQTNVKVLGANWKHFQSSVSFRYASGFDQSGLAAKWLGDSDKEVPRLLEYTIRVWPVQPAVAFAESRDSTGRPLGF